MLRIDKSASSTISILLGRFVSICFILILTLAMAHSQSVQAAAGRVQELHGSVFPGELYYYRLDGLQAGEHLYVYMENVSGNLDPVVAVIAGGQDIMALEEQYKQSVRDAVAPR